MHDRAKMLVLALQDKAKSMIENGEYSSYAELSRSAGVDPAGFTRFMNEEFRNGVSKVSFKMMCGVLYAVGGKVEIPGFVEPEPDLGYMTTWGSIDYLLKTGDPSDVSLAEAIMKRLQKASGTWPASAVDGEEEEDLEETEV